MSAPAAAVAAAKPIGFVDYLKSKLTVDVLEDLALRLVRYAEATIVGEKKGAERRAWTKSQIMPILEAFDDRIPVLGQWMDYPIVDWLENWAVDMLIEWAWGKMESLEAQKLNQ